MEPFKSLTATAAPLDVVNVDTDMIIPKQFLKTIKRTGLGVHLFDEMRYDNNGNEIKDFILNQDHYRNSQILVAGDNFGCGSSREHAPWSLADFGIKVIIAPSFADIFYNNCFKNGILPIALDNEKVSKLMLLAKNKETSEISVNLEDQIIKAGNLEYNFDVDSFRKKCLLEGLDDIGLTLQHEDKISKYEEKHKQNFPWLWNN